MDLMIEDLMEQLVQGGGSDLHLATGQPPYGRFSGELRSMTDRPLAEEDCNKLIFSMLNNSQRKTLEQTWELDCAYGLKGCLLYTSPSPRDLSTSRMPSSA